MQGVADYIALFSIILLPRVIRYSQQNISGDFAFLSSNRTQWRFDFDTGPAPNLEIVNTAGHNFKRLRRMEAGIFDSA